MSARHLPVEWFESDPFDLAARRTRSSGTNTVPFLRVITTGTRAANEPLLDSLDRRLSELSEYEEGWDGNESAAPSDDAIANARAFLQEAFRSAIADPMVSADWRKPHITANEDGDIVFEWWNGDRKLTLYFEPASASFIRSWGAHVINDMQDGDFEPEQFGAHWGWLYG
jgi:hypothetical protein